MALAFVITLDKELPGAGDSYKKSGAGKALAREISRLDLAARTKKVTAIESFLSENPDVLREQLKADGFDPSKMRLPPEQWFTADEGLTTVRGLTEHVTAKLNDFKQPNPILRDLKAIETLLMAAQTAGVRFHFAKVDL
ncbi:hypothetical protein BH09PLA1_BH09PLA1_11390 [soil metagenome]